MTIITGDLPRELADAFLECRTVGVDTETSGLHWQTDRLLLCQLFAPAVGPVLLRNVSRRPSELARVLESTRVQKVFHFAPFDLRFIDAQWDITAVNVACTKAASKIVNPEAPHAEHSLAPLVSRLLGVHLDKGAVRTSDWSSNSLTDEQIRYATSDVRHLPALLSVLRSQLRSARKTSHWRAVCHYMPIDAHLEVTGTPNPLTY